jgi:predicted RNase H-like nuclease
MTPSKKKQKKAQQCWIGVDGTRTGWVAFIWQSDDDYQLWHINRLHELDTLRSHTVNAIGIDIPIGLSEVAEKGGRGCDRQARRILSTAKRNALKEKESSTSSRQELSIVGPSSIFTPPCRKALDFAFASKGDKIECCCTHAQVSAANKDSVKSDDKTTLNDGDGLGLSIQTYHILPKIKEADDFVSAGATSSPSTYAVSVNSNVPVLECHPELGFLSLTFNVDKDKRIEEASALYSKKLFQGRRQRLELLCQEGGLDAQRLLSLVKTGGETTSESPIEQLSQLRSWRIASLTDQSADERISVAADDVLDAMICAVTSKRWSLGQAKAVGEDCSTMLDNRHLPMVIWM